jgi:hypothetical protein
LTLAAYPSGVVYRFQWAVRQSSGRRAVVVYGVLVLKHGSGCRWSSRSRRGFDATCNSYDRLVNHLPGFVSGHSFTAIKSRSIAFQDIAGPTLSFRRWSEDLISNGDLTRVDAHSASETHPSERLRREAETILITPLRSHRPEGRTQTCGHRSNNDRCTMWSKFDLILL